MSISCLEEDLPEKILFKATNGCLLSFSTFFSLNGVFLLEMLLRLSCLFFFFGSTNSCRQCHIFLDSTHFISSCHQINHGLVLFFYFLSLFPNFFIFYFSSYFGMFLLQLIFSALAVVLIASKDSLFIEMSLSIIYKDIFPHT